MNADIFDKKETNFVLWCQHDGSIPPELIIGQLQLGTPVSFINEQHFNLVQHSQFSDLWLISANKCDLKDEEVYHYWFEVTDPHPRSAGQNVRIKITDPMAYTVNWGLLATRPLGNQYNSDDEYPATVIKYSQGKLLACDVGGETGQVQNSFPLSNLASNNRTVIYELPTSWTILGRAGERETGVGSFRDTTALIDKSVEGANFSDLDILQLGASYLPDLGINALELLPPADSFYSRQWGYGTTNYFAPDFELGFPYNYSWPTSNRDLCILISACHAKGIRFFIDVVMAFARTNAYLAAATNDFFILDPKENKNDPDAHNSRGKDDNNLRDGFGSSLFRYAAFFNRYNPVTGHKENLSPAGELMKASIIRWINTFLIDGIRMDSVENVYNWNFIQEYKDLARDAFRNRYTIEPIGVVNERFLVVGEELNEPMEILTQNRLDGLWHEKFKKYIRAALIGRNADGENTFEWTVKKAIDCRLFNYPDVSKAVIYLTSHDVEGFGNERLFNFFDNNGVADKEKRTKLAFVCLLTAVGIPMILAGDEFADQHDQFDAKGHVSQNGRKQVDPVNFSRLKDDWRGRVKVYVSRLIKFRTSSNALSVNDTKFIHVDFNEGKRVVVWVRGNSDTDQVVVVANFSDFSSSTSFAIEIEYKVPNWPSTPLGKKWREITQDREVPDEWVGREPIFAWEAKVYSLV